MRAYKYCFVSETVYARLCKEIDKLASGPARPDQPHRVQDVANRQLAAFGTDDLRSITHLSELNLRGQSEWREIAKTLHDAQSAAT